MSASAAEAVAILPKICRQLGAMTGTIHRVDGNHLVLQEAFEIPETVKEQIRRIPKGKGMAGQAWSTARPAQTCNLAADPSAAIQPRARHVHAGAAVAAPITDESGIIWAVVGLGFPPEKTMDEEAVDAVGQEAVALVRSLLGRAQR